KGKEPRGLLKLLVQADRPNAQQVPVTLAGADGKARLLEGSVTKEGGGLKLTLPDAYFDLRPAQSPRANNDGIKQYYLQQFKEADVNKKGYLERKLIENNQYQYFLAFFALADRDGDNKLTEKELSAYLDLQAEGASCLVGISLFDLGRG